MEVTVKDRQSLLDIALQYGGGLESMFDIAVRNGINPTQELPDGLRLDISPASVVMPEIATRYKVLGICPATALQRDDLTKCPCGGINYMSVEVDFIVS